VFCLYGLWGGYLEWRKNMKTKISSSTVDNNNYVYSEIDIELQPHDTDINVILPSGKIMVVQCRVEGPSIDICMGDPEASPPKTWEAINWIGPDMKPAPVVKTGKKHFRETHEVNQICLCMSEEEYFGDSHV
jgi:hypothetical protein